MGRKKTANWYWFSETDDAVHRYNAAETPEEKNEIYETHLHYPLTRLAEYLINTIPTNLIKMNRDEKLNWVRGEMVEALPKVEAGKNPFAYLQITGRNAIWGTNMKIKRNGSYKHLSIDFEYETGWNIEIPVAPDTDVTDIIESYNVYVKQLRSYWDEYDQLKVTGKGVREVISVLITLMETVHDTPSMDLNKHLSEYMEVHCSMRRPAYLRNMAMIRPLLKVAHENFMESDSIHSPTRWEWSHYKLIYTERLKDNS